MEPFPRSAVHLLELLGKPLEEAAGGELVGTDFLLEVMEVREELEECENDAARLVQLREANRLRVLEVSAELGSSFSQHDLVKARALTAQLQYLQRIEDEIRAKTEPT